MLIVFVMTKKTKKMKQTSHDVTNLKCGVTLKYAHVESIAT